jgi:putative ABC transport system permease protein
VSDATPVLVELIRLRGQQSAEPKYVLGIGVIPSKNDETIASVSTAKLTPGDPYYADGEYDGTFTGEVILSPAAAQLLNASQSDRLAAGSLTTTRVQRDYTVTAVASSGPETVQGQFPVAVFHLSELQRLTGADVGDHADQILVRTNRPQVKSEVQAVYPDSAVVTRTSLTTRQLFDSKLPLALSTAAGIIGFVVSTLFLATTMSLEVDADRATLGVFAALGYSTRTRLLMTLTSTFLLALLGSLVGIVLGVAGILLVNAVTAARFGVGQIAILHPLLPVVAVTLSLVVALFAAPYPLSVVWRTDPLSEVGR